MERSDPAYSGQRGYGPPLLAIYDWWVLGFMAHAVLRSPTQSLVDRYRPLFGSRHLDIGPGTGYFIDVAAPHGMELTLLDPNHHVLRHSAQRLSRFSPTLVEADVLKPLPLAGPFDSIGLSAVLHCLPGPMEAKAKAISNAASVLAPDGVVFGATVLGLADQPNFAARSFIRIANRSGAFDNVDDTREGLERILSASFDDVDSDVLGSLALFTARDPKNNH